jgi:hypothetical protein
MDITAGAQTDSRTLNVCSSWLSWKRVKLWTKRAVAILAGIPTFVVRRWALVVTVSILSVLMLTFYYLTPHKTYGSLLVQKRILDIYHEVTVSCLDLLAFIFVTPEFIRQETFDKIGNWLDERATRMNDRILHYYKGTLCKRRIIPFFCAVAIVGSMAFISDLFDLDDIYTHDWRVLAGIAVFDTVEGIAGLVVIVYVYSYFLLFYFYIWAMILHLILRYFKLGKMLLRIGIVSFLVARAISISYAYVEANDRAVHFSPNPTEGEASLGRHAVPAGGMAKPG